MRGGPWRFGELMCALLAAYLAFRVRLWPHHGLARRLAGWPFNVECRMCSHQVTEQVEEMWLLMRNYIDCSAGFTIARPPSGWHAASALTPGQELLSLRAQMEYMKQRSPGLGGPLHCALMRCYSCVLCICLHVCSWSVSSLLLFAALCSVLVHLILHLALGPHDDDDDDAQSGHILFLALRTGSPPLAHDIQEQ
ncbi:hypothetical protein DFH27DRAFT_238480 [Peziza echinospora]|nr:hypothetical protein DFH27DRAFT_238480 [Peziza echinospora]